MARFADLGVAASVQFSHAPSDRDLADDFWAGRLEAPTPSASLVDSGAVVANGSDAPVEELDPLLRDQGRRHCARSTRVPAWHPEQALTVEQALQASTVAPAWLTGDERRRGPAPARLSWPTSSCSTATRSTCPPDELGEV